MLHHCQALSCALGEMGQPATTGGVEVPRSSHSTWGVPSAAPQVPSVPWQPPKPPQIRHEVTASSRHTARQTGLCFRAKPSLPPVIKIVIA